jgi:uncharacterized damage-inducible protein DinB
MATKAVQQGTVSSILIGRWEQASEKLSALAEEIPENKFSYKPGEGVRTIAEVLRHVAFWSRYVAACGRGEKGDDAANELPGTEFSTKARILAALKHGAEDASAAFKGHRSGLRPELIETLVTFIEHTVSTMASWWCMRG